MPDGKTHAKASIIMAVSFTLGTLATHNFSDIEYAIGALLGTVLTPDLDVDNGYIGDKYIKNKLGTLAGFGWSSTWHIYRSSVKHGSPLSHFPIVGTLARLAYLFFFAIVVPTFAMSLIFPQVQMEREMSWWVWHILPHWKIVLGLMSSDFHHYVMDISTVNNKFSLGSLINRKTNYHRRKQ